MQFVEELERATLNNAELRHSLNEAISHTRRPGGVDFEDFQSLVWQALSLRVGVIHFDPAGDFLFQSPGDEAGVVFMSRNNHFDLLTYNRTIDLRNRFVSRGPLRGDLLNGPPAQDEGEDSVDLAPCVVDFAQGL